MLNRWSKTIWTFFISVLIGAFLTFGYAFYQLVYTPMMTDEKKTVIIQVDKNSSAHSFAHSLQKEQLIHSPRLFLLLLRAQGLTHCLKAGVYEVLSGESAQSFAFRVVSGDVLKGSFAIIEGTTKAQVEENLKTAPYLAYHSSDWQFIQNGYPTAEGLLLADTYQYDAGSDGKALLVRARNNLKEYLAKTWEQRRADLPYKNPYELLIAASILEKETSSSQEKRLVSSVVVNRLNKNMPLQVDPTVIYALGPNYTGKLSREHLSVDSPYNTYRHRGLPPAPIAMVGKDAIDAAAHPMNTNFLYFVAKGDGSHHFSETYEQQKQAVARYLKNIKK